MSFLQSHQSGLAQPLDFAPNPMATIQGQLTRAIDKALVEHKRQEYEARRGSGEGDVARNRIGAGYIGLECMRELAYRYHKAPKEERESSVSPGELQRHAESGHWTEERTAEWLSLAGFDIRTHKTNPDGSPKIGYDGKPEQIGYKAAFDHEIQQYRIAGEVDGVILEAPANITKQKNFPLPWIWESKKGTNKKWKTFEKNGVAKADPKYHGQLQTNMAYLEIKHTLFSMLNLDTMKYHWEIVTFNPDIAQRLSDRAVQVIGTSVPEEAPRITSDRADYRCRFCDYKSRCWSSL